jgi:hypothetical protein
MSSVARQSGYRANAIEAARSSEEARSPGGPTGHRPPRSRRTPAVGESNCAMPPAGRVESCISFDPYVRRADGSDGAIGRVCAGGGLAQCVRRLATLAVCIQNHSKNESLPKPPLRFRQFRVTDLEGWKPRTVFGTFESEVRSCECHARHRLVC